MADHIVNRDKITQALREELVGPSPQGKPINCRSKINFQSEKDFYGPWRQENGEEIIQRDAPVVRYGVGVLFPMRTKLEDEDSKSSREDKDSDQDNQPDEKDASEVLITDEVNKSLEQIKEGVADSVETESDDFDLSTANAYKPSSMGVSFLGEFPTGSVLLVKATGGRYQQKTVKVSGSERTWWLRSPVSITAEFEADALCER